jgi:Zn-dependent M28 family amino/carboxypeptidase
MKHFYLGESKEKLKSHVEHLASTICARSIYKPDKLNEAAKYIQDLLEGWEFTVESQEYRVWKTPVRNLVANVDGAPERPYYLVGAHYDTVSHTPGADDNASAVAVVLELARLVSQGILEPASPLALVFFTLEEPPTFGTPLMGSRVYASRAKKAGYIIKGALILEMVGYYCHEKGCQSYPPFIRQLLGLPNVGDFIGIIGDGKSRKLVEELEEAFKKNPALPVHSLAVPLRGHSLPGSRLSDNASFWDVGYPAVMITDTAYYRNPNYHASGDTPDTLDYATMAQLVKSLALFLEGAR